MIRAVALLCLVACGAPAAPQPADAAVPAPPPVFSSPPRAALMVRSAFLLGDQPADAVTELRDATLAALRGRAAPELAWLAGLAPEDRARAAAAGLVEARLMGSPGALLAALLRDLPVEPAPVVGVPSAAWRLQRDADWRVRVAAAPLTARMGALAETLRDGARLATEEDLGVVATELDAVLVGVAELQAVRLNGEALPFRFAGDRELVALLDGPVLSGWLGLSPP